MDQAKISAAVSTMDRLLGGKLTGRDKDFLESLSAYYNRTYTLTEKQVSFITSIAQNYGEESVKWTEEFDEEKRERFKFAVKYYSKTGYFRNICDNYYLDQTFVPSKRQYEKMCMNKYIERAIQNYKAPPRYNVGDIITVRKGMLYQYRYDKNDDSPLVGMVESIDPTISFTQGNRRYNIFWMTGDGYKVVFEKDIKLYREPKKKNETPTEV